MTTIFGLDPSSPWTAVVRRPPASQILGYVCAKWLKYEAQYGSIGKPLHERDEPSLTQGLAAFLAAEYERGAQQIDGDFHAEVHTYDLQSDGTALYVGRTDIEWRLFGTPSFVIEFKILDGSKKRRDLYLSDGIARFVQGVYARLSREGAMCAFLRPGATTDVELIIEGIKSAAVQLRCHPHSGPWVTSPSKVAPDTATFETAHVRDPANASPILLIHLFLAIAVASGEKTDL